MQRLAEKGGVAVFVKRDGTELIRRIKDEKPQVVLMDMFMPGYDAMGVMHAISEDTATEKPMYIVAASCPMPSLEREPVSYTHLDVYKRQGRFHACSRDNNAAEHPSKKTVSEIQ